MKLLLSSIALAGIIFTAGCTKEANVGTLTFKVQWNGQLAPEGCVVEMYSNPSDRDNRTHPDAVFITMNSQFSTGLQKPGTYYFHSRASFDTCTVTPKYAYCRLHLEKATSEKVEAGVDKLITVELQ